MSNPCGHTDEEHKALAVSAQQAIEGGDLSPLLPVMDNDNLVKLVQRGLLELFVRVQGYDEAKQLWEKFDNDVRTIVLAKNAEESADPELWNDIQRERIAYAEGHDIPTRGGHNIPAAPAAEPSKPRYADPGGESDRLYL